MRVRVHRHGGAGRVKFYLATSVDYEHPGGRIGGSRHRIQRRLLASRREVANGGHSRHDGAMDVPFDGVGLRSLGHLSLKDGEAAIQPNHQFFTRLFRYHHAPPKS